MRERFKLLLLPVCILAAYLPGLSSGLFIFDDLGIIEYLQKNGLDAIRLLPGETSRYVRTLVMLSFLVDVKLWNAHSGLMHLENLLLHAANAALVFLIVKTIVANKLSRQNSWVPLLAALLFALHPVTTESVNWIAGRSDPLSALFVLLGMLLLLKALFEEKSAFGYSAALLFFLGCLTKEVAFFALLGAIGIPWLYKSRSTDRNEQGLRWKVSLPLLMSALGYLLLRTRVFTGLDKGTSDVVAGLAKPTDYITEHGFNILTSLGFYLKKLFVPYPLNFAIDEISPHFFWIGLLAIPVVLYFLWQRDLRSGMILLLILCIAPAILNALYHIAWTPYAERYLYLPAAFFSIALFIPFGNQVNRSRIRTLILCLLFANFIPTTLYRNLQWQDSMVILADARRQNPDNINLHINYAIVLADHEGYQAARRELLAVLDKDSDNEHAYINLAKTALFLMNDPKQAREDLDVYFSGKLIPSADLSELMREITAKCQLKETPCEG